MSSIDDVLSGKALDHHAHAFVSYSAADTCESIRSKAAALQARGIDSLNMLWEAGPGSMKLAPFNADEYWERLGWVVDTCHELGMTFMLQDAAPFPTGAADGLFALPENRHLNKLYLVERHLDVAGPLPQACLKVGTLANAMLSHSGMTGLPEPRKVVAVVAMRREGDRLDATSAVDLTDQVADGLLWWDVPAGHWRVFAIAETYDEGGRAHYMNLLDPESVALQIEAVHKPHYEHLKDELGSTWLGLFYDETEVGNVREYVFDAKLGAPALRKGGSMSLPWSRQMPGLVAARLGEDYRRKLPLLWYEDLGDAFRPVRYTYMDVAARQIEVAYNGQVEAWCAERGIPYFGHNLEDENVHCRLGCGPVHYFRMQKHQSKAGIDVIGGQLMPGGDLYQDWYGYPDGDGAFYHYGLAKLAGSAARIDPHKQGQAFCELLALYGDIAGTKVRRFVVDHLAVNGVTDLIYAQPEAGGIPDRFLASAHAYSERLCNVLGTATATSLAAVLYHGEAEWFDGTCQPFQLPAAELARRQVSHDVVPADIFDDPAFYGTRTEGGLTVNGNAYQALVVPACTAVPRSVAAFVDGCAQTGLPVVFVDQAPSHIAETGEPWVPATGTVVALDELGAVVAGLVRRDVVATGDDASALRAWHGTLASGSLYFVVNEGRAWKGELALAGVGNAVRIDLEALAARELAATPGDNFLHMSLELGEYESTLIFVGKPDFACEPALPGCAIVLDTPWEVRVAGEEPLLLAELRSLNAPDLLPTFGGEAVYTASVELPQGSSIMDLGLVGEACELLVNGVSCGMRTAAPYAFDVRKAIHEGTNEVEVRVHANTCHQDFVGEGIPAAMAAFAGAMHASTFSPLPDGGLMGPVSVR